MRMWINLHVCKKFFMLNVSNGSVSLTESSDKINVVITVKVLQLFIQHILKAERMKQHIQHCSRNLQN